MVQGRSCLAQRRARVAQGRERVAQGRERVAQGPNRVALGRARVARGPNRLTNARKRVANAREHVAHAREHVANAAQLVGTLRSMTCASPAMQSLRGFATHVSNGALRGALCLVDRSATALTADEESSFAHGRRALFGAGVYTTLDDARCRGRGDAAGRSAALARAGRDQRAEGVPPTKTA